MRFPLSDAAISSILHPRNRDWETSFRSVLRRLGYEPTFKGGFLSGEVIQDYCDGVLMPNGVFSRADKLLIDTQGPLNLFLKSDHLEYLISAISQFKLKPTKHSLFLHNSDISHSADIMNQTLKIFGRIFVTNWLGDIPGVHAIPIGLENQSYLRNGIQKDYFTLRKSGLMSFDERPISLLKGFSIETNKIERSTALNTTKDVDGSLVLTVGVSPKRYRHLVGNSKYVLSPPGNGPDCHRTWEAIYLGAIPIVKRNFWPEFDFQPPVVVVDEWTEVAEVVRKGCQPENSQNNWQDNFWKMVKNE